MFPKVLFLVVANFCLVHIIYILKIYCKFTGEHPCRKAISIKWQSNFIEIKLRHGCSPVNLLHIFRASFLNNTSRRLFLKIIEKTPKQWQISTIESKTRFPLGDKWRYLTIIFWWYLTIILKISVIRFTYIKSEFWSSFDIFSDSEGKDILFLQLVVLFKMKKKKRRKRKKWVRELFRKREEKEAFNNLIQKMKLADRVLF